MVLGAVIKWLNKWRPDPWKEKIDMWEVIDQMDESDRDHRDWQHKRGRYVDRPD